MYGLSAQQKKALRKAVVRYTKLYSKYPDDATELEEYEDIEEMNPTEVFYQRANMFVIDLQFVLAVNKVF